MTATIHNVKLDIGEDLRVEADSNPVSIYGGDTVVWQFSLPVSLEDHQVTIEFKSFEPDEPGLGTGHHPRFGPFQAVSLAGRVFSANGDNGRRGHFLYAVRLVNPAGVEGNALGWSNGQNGGGLDVGGPPP